MKNIKTRNDFAKFIGVKLQTLTYLLYIKKIDNCYNTLEIPKKNGDTRTICVPNKNLKKVQKKLYNKLSTYYDEIKTQNNFTSKISHGFEKNRSIVTNAEVHKNKRYVVNLDLLDFFPSINFGRVRSYFIKNNYFEINDDIATILAQLTCYKGTLPQGAPTSPLIANMICNIMDIRILKIAKKYRLDYTRYADDLTFSTNNKYFLNDYDKFLEDIKNIIHRSGFELNSKKTRLLFSNSRQEVTGLVVNKKISVPKEYYKNTRAMAHSLYKNGYFLIDDEVGTIEQLEGRFSFINQINLYNIDNKKKDMWHLNSKEKQYQKFMIYKTFYANEKPLIITEGKTDVLYIKAALKKYYKYFPNLITKKDNGNFVFHVNFFKRKQKHSYYLNLVKDGADTIKNIYSNCYIKTKNNKNITTVHDFKKLRGERETNPVILIFDNEMVSNKDRPLKKFLNEIKVNASQKDKLKENLYINICDNLYLCTYQLNNKEACEIEIEDLFPADVLEHEINGRKFSKKDSTHDNGFYGKNEFSQYVYSNYESIDFSNFISLLSAINEIIELYPNNI
ncbi:RNA-directed DNA polymerase [Coprobacillus sp. AM23-9LB]|jgi:RNA-directed DNA polymerase|uniref:retron Ec67 family RNA-directed DNA polymerase/endonuclease n=1 Tax=Faecalibacillus intestinalis TaxID=1982626 RepID=UPI000E3F9ECE|nr:retron Ec67 family RNA-directed DNA polymerase/endonuclease [Faecalibacillus intestinalis]RGE93164.1 RNA-directed DNA polymerase [Coprobacillus sp. AM23-9LB]